MNNSKCRFSRTAHSVSLVSTIVATLTLLPCLAAFADYDGFLTKDSQRQFPIGFYELPKDDAGLKAMAESGVNLVRCHNRADLDRVGAVGMMGVMPLSLQAGATEEFRGIVESVRDHPALAVWEGPDEIVWNFTAYSGLHRTMGIHKTSGEWWRQTPEAVAYAEERAGEIMPNMRAAIELIRELDRADRPIWINEALKSDLKYVRQYLDVIDITGCDIYPVRKDDRKVERMGAAMDRWMQVGRGKPVWMVLQAFSWNELGDYYGVKDTSYPTFIETRFMAYDVIVHGARGVLYWGSHYLKSDSFRESVYALTSELSALQPFLVALDQDGPRVRVIPGEAEEETTGVRMTVRQSGGEWLVVLVNENDHGHMGVEVTGLEDLNGRGLDLLYGQESVTVQQGGFATRIQPYEVKVFATDRKWETPRRRGRDYEE